MSENYFIFKDSGIFLQNSHLTVLLFCRFLLEVERSVVILTDIPLQLMQHVSMVAFKTFPFKSLIMMCLSMNLFQFILWEVILAFWVCGFCLLHRFWKFAFIISLNSLLSLSLSFYCGSPLIQAYFLQALDTVIFFFFWWWWGQSILLLYSDWENLNKSSSLLLWHLYY